MLTAPPVQPVDTVDLRFREIACQISALHRRCRQGLCCKKLLQTVSDAVAGLPLTTEEYGRATCHLANAKRYLATGERGAGRYELRMLVGVLASGS
jgi:hypothetical protein